MIVGDGDVAKALKEVDRDDLLFFASGVSNSKETSKAEFDKEKELLFETFWANPDKRIVYFGSLSIFYSDTPYAKHKRRMETYIKIFNKYTIIRLGNIDWGVNPNTIINYLKAHPEAEIWDVYRYVITKDEFLHWIRMIPTFNCEMNCPGQRLKVKEIKEKYVD